MASELLILHMYLAMHLDVSVALGTVFFFTPQALADTTSEVDTGTNSTTVAANNTTENHTTNNKVSLTNATSAPVDTSKDTVQTPLL